MPSAPPVVVLYSQTGCTDSARVRAWLTAQQIPFVERNVTEDAAAAAALAATGIFATPLLVVGGRQVFGFRPQAIADALRAASLPLDSH